MKPLLILGIESSCDETAASVVRNGREVLSNIIYSQIDIHKVFGGVVPEIASRNHAAKIDAVVGEALSEANVKIEEIDAIAPTHGPGLVGALLVGLSFGKALSFAAEKPLVGVHHIEGHISSVYLNSQFAPPFMCLVVSGGHTHLVYVKDYCDYEILGRTRDDAAGEAFDKVARALGFPYPGGVSIERISKEGDAQAIRFPRAMSVDGNFDFSFSGLKSAVLNYINTCKMNEVEYKPEDVAASFQASVVETLTSKAIAACALRGCKKLALAGGVASNGALRARMSDVCEQNGLEFYVPEPVFCTDNAAMIASCGYFSFLKGKTDALDLNAYPNLDLVKVV